MTVIHHQGCTLDPNHDQTEECTVLHDNSSTVLGYPGEHSRGCTLGNHTLDVPCSPFSYTPPASRPPYGRRPPGAPERPEIATTRLDVEIPETPFETLRRAEDGPQRAKIQYGGLSVDVASEDPGLFGRVIAAIGDAITMALGD
jgi:hypothetical protein